MPPQEESQTSKPAIPKKLKKKKGKQLKHAIAQQLAEEARASTIKGYVLPPFSATTLKNLINNISDTQTTRQPPV